MQKCGFTLIELLIVISIVGILASAIAPLFKTTRYDAQYAKVMADLEAIKHAAYMLHLDTGEWPPFGRNDGCGLITNDDGTGSPIPGWQGPYLDEWEDDPWGNTIYVNEMVGNRLYVETRGPDKLNDTADDIQLLITPDNTK